MGFFRVLLYQLKRYFGANADIYYESVDTVDLTTGNRVVTKLKWSITRAICLPTSTSASSLFPLAIKALWKQGGDVQFGDKTIVIDRKDFPEGFRLETHNYSVIVDRRRYEILKVEEYEFEVAYILTLKELTGARVYEQVEVTLEDEVEVDDAQS